MPSLRAVRGYLTGCAYIVSAVLLAVAAFWAVRPAEWLAGLVVSGVGYDVLAIVAWAALVYALVWVFLRVWNPDK
jgi:hypothetical protein